MANRAKSERLNLRVSPEQAKALRRLVRVSKSQNMTEVICRALAVYDHLWEAQQKNMQVIVRNESTDEEQPLLLL